MGKCHLDSCSSVIMGVHDRQDLRVKGALASRAHESLGGKKLFCQLWEGGVPPLWFLGARKFISVGGLRTRTVPVCVCTKDVDEQQLQVNATLLSLLLL